MVCDTIYDPYTVFCFICFGVKSTLNVPSICLTFRQRKAILSTNLFPVNPSTSLCLVPVELVKPPHSSEEPLRYQVHSRIPTFLSWSHSRPPCPRVSQSLLPQLLHSLSYRGTSLTTDSHTDPVYTPSLSPSDRHLYSDLFSGSRCKTSPVYFPKPETDFS